MSARTANQQLAISTAMEIFHDADFTQLNVVNMEHTTRTVIAQYVGRLSDAVLGDINVAYTGLPIMLEGGRFTARVWAERLATEIMLHVIRQICGLNPVHGEGGEKWIFLGSAICADRHDTRVLLPGQVVADVEVVDLFATAEGDLKAVCDYGTATSTVDDIAKPLGLGCDNANLHEAARRFRLLEQCVSA